LSSYEPIGPDIPDALRPPLRESEAVENYERPPARELEDRGPTATELRRRALEEPAP
jgi:hypothetical protein